MDNHSIIRFDWAAKRLLRNKANYAVLEGLVTVLLGEKISIIEMLESESNQDSANDKFNRVDIKAKDSKGDIILIEIQLTREWYYLQRVLYGVSKTITEHISLGSKYEEVKKIYSINILYFDLGKGSDYLYHGTTTFIGVHTKDELIVRKRDKDAIRTCSPTEIFPEYFLIRVNEFNEVAKTPIEEWMDFLKNNHIKDNTETPGLREAKEQLRVLQMNDAERKAYDNYLDTIRTQDSVLDTYRTEGLLEGRMIGREEGRKEGREEGREEGRKEERKDMAKKMLAMGMEKTTITKLTGLSDNELTMLFT